VNIWDEDWADPSPGTLRQLSCDPKKLERTLSLIPDRATQEKAATFETQNDVKAYLKTHMSKLEGLRLVRSEYPTLSGPFDFLCRDTKKVPVVVEVAAGLNGDTGEIGDLMKYIGAYGRKSRARRIRGILVAKQFSRDAREAARAKKELALFTCKLIPTFQRMR
jgi:RecB family endonuclease NucS